MDPDALSPYAPHRSSAARRSDCGLQCARGPRRCLLLRGVCSASVQSRFFMCCRRARCRAPRPPQLAVASGGRASRSLACNSSPTAVMIVTDGSSCFFARAVPLRRSRSSIPPSFHSHFCLHARHGSTSTTGRCLALVPLHGSNAWAGWSCGLALAARGRLSSPTDPAARQPAHDTFHQKTSSEAISHRFHGFWVSQTRNESFL